MVLASDVSNYLLISNFDNRDALNLRIIVFCFFYVSYISYIIFLYYTKFIFHFFQNFFFLSFVMFFSFFIFYACQFLCGCCTDANIRYITRIYPHKHNMNTNLYIHTYIFISCSTRYGTPIMFTVGPGR